MFLAAIGRNCSCFLHALPDRCCKASVQLLPWQYLYCADLLAFSHHYFRHYRIFQRFTFHLGTPYFQAAHALVDLSGNCLSTVPFCIVGQATLLPAVPDVQCRNGWFLAIRLVHGLNRRTVGSCPRPRPFLPRRGLSLFIRSTAFCSLLGCNSLRPPHLANRIGL